MQQLNSALIEIKRLTVDEVMILEFLLEFSTYRILEELYLLVTFQAALICTDLIVTNLLCPAIINPENIGIISDTHWIINITHIPHW